MKMSAASFKQWLENAKARQQNVILMGMSGTGKSHWSRRLAKACAAQHIEYDDLIGRSPELSALLASYPGHDRAAKMGHYLGMPWTAGFDDKEERFLALEGRIMNENLPASGTILDLSGSAVYHPEAMARIAETGLVIYLEASPDAQDEMFEMFIKHPKPVCWRGMFKPLSGETNEESLKRCYPLLLKQRDALYRVYADVIVPYDRHKKARHAKQLIEAIIEELSSH